MSTYVYERHTLYSVWLVIVYKVEPVYNGHYLQSQLPL